MADALTELRQKRHALRVRSEILFAIRAFFRERDFLEVDTPVRLPAPALEEHIDAEPCGEWFLRTSPELHMKRLLAAGYPRIFQIGPCFRRGESGHLHHPEYAMLEWYRADADYLRILEDTRALIASIGRHLQSLNISVPAAFEREWIIQAVREVFRKWAGWDPVIAFDADRFDVDLVERVEPQLKRLGGPFVLMDYPAPLAALARLKPDQPQVGERWELYIDGIEIANAYSELADADEQARRFEQCAARRRAAGHTVYPLDQHFLEALSAMPAAGGIALGIDRLVMMYTGHHDLSTVIAFQEHERQD